MRNDPEATAQTGAHGLSLSGVGPGAAREAWPPGRLTPDCRCLRCTREPPFFREAFSSGKEGRALGDGGLFALQEESRFKVAFAMGFLSWSLECPEVFILPSITRYLLPL